MAHRQAPQPGTPQLSQDSLKSCDNMLIGIVALVVHALVPRPSRPTATCPYLVHP